MTERVLGPDVQQRTEQAGVGQVEFGTLVDGLCPVREPWLEPRDLPGSLFWVAVVICKKEGSIETRKYRGEGLVSAPAGPDFRTAMIHAPSLVGEG